MKAVYVIAAEVAERRDIDPKAVVSSNTMAARGVRGETAYLTKRLTPLSTETIAEALNRAPQTIAAGTVRVQANIDNDPFYAAELSSFETQIRPILRHLAVSDGIEESLALANHSSLDRFERSLDRLERLIKRVPEPIVRSSIPMPVPQAIAPVIKAYRDFKSAQFSIHERKAFDALDKALQTLCEQETA